MIGKLALLRAAVVGVLLGPMVVRRDGTGRARTRALLTLLAGAQVAWVVVLLVNHVNYPFLLDLMEATVLEHVARLAAGQAVYPAPSADFVPLAYNPLFYVASAPFTRLFGTSLPVVRAVAIVGYLACAAALFVLAFRATRSRWAGLVVVGLFAAAYRAMDAYLDTAHSDSWMLACALWGTILLQEASRWQGRAAAVLVFVAGFWFKQHGALFAMMAVAVIWLQQGWRAAAPHALLAAALGPGLQFLAGPVLFGSHYRFFTLDVPAGWSVPDPSAITRLAGFVFRWYGVPLVASAVGLLRSSRSGMGSLEVFQLMLVPAAASALLGSLDPGSSDNVFIPVGTWLVLCGGIQLTQTASATGASASYVGLAATMAFLLYDPRPVFLAHGKAREQLHDLQRVIDSLARPVYLPTHGPLPGVRGLSPRVHWVALDDLSRGPSAPDSGMTLRRTALLPLSSAPASAQYMLLTVPLTPRDRVLGPLHDRYELVADFGDRWSALRFLPKRWGDYYGQPRYLYRSVGTTPR